MDNIVATPTVDAPKGQPAVKGEGQHHAEKSVGDMPLENYELDNAKDYVYDAFEVGEKVTDLPAEMNDKLSSTSKYIKSVMKKEGLEPTTKGYRRALDLVLTDLGIDKEASLDNKLDRIHGFIKAVKMIKGFKYMDEEKMIAEIKKQKSSKDMEDRFLREMDTYLSYVTD